MNNSKNNQPNTILDNQPKPYYDYDGLTGVWLWIPWWFYCLLAIFVWPLCHYLLPFLSFHYGSIHIQLADYTDEITWIIIAFMVLSALLSAFKRWKVEKRKRKIKVKTTPLNAQKIKPLAPKVDKHKITASVKDPIIIEGELIHDASVKIIEKVASTVPGQKKPAKKAPATQAVSETTAITEPQKAIKPTEDETLKEQPKRRRTTKPSEKTSDTETSLQAPKARKTRKTSDTASSTRATKAAKTNKTTDTATSTQATKTRKTTKKTATDPNAPKKTRKPRKTATTKDSTNQSNTKDQSNTNSPPKAKRTYTRRKPKQNTAQMDLDL